MREAVDEPEEGQVKWQLSNLPCRNGRAEEKMIDGSDLHIFLCAAAVERRKEGRSDGGSNSHSFFCAAVGELRNAWGVEEFSNFLLRLAVMLQQKLAEQCDVGREVDIVQFNVLQYHVCSC